MLNDMILMAVVCTDRSSSFRESTDGQECQLSKTCANPLARCFQRVCIPYHVLVCAV